MTFLEAHVPGFVGTLKLSAESKAERVAAHLDQISKCRCGRRGARDRPRATPSPAAARLKRPPGSVSSSGKKQEYQTDLAHGTQEQTNGLLRHL